MHLKVKFGFQTIRKHDRHIDGWSYLQWASQFKEILIFGSTLIYLVWLSSKHWLHLYRECYSLGISPAYDLHSKVEIIHSFYLLSPASFICPKEYHKILTFAKLCFLPLKYFLEQAMITLQEMAVCNSLYGS